MEAYGFSMRFETMMVGAESFELAASSAELT